MTQTQLEDRTERSENGALVASKTEEGFRVYSLHNPSQIYLVRQEGERLTCTCEDFETHKTDTTWRCKHILVIAPWDKNESAPLSERSGDEQANAPAPAETTGEPPLPKRKGRRANEPVTPVQMLIKRSVSPDGRIDSVSVEFSMAVSDQTETEIKAKALKSLYLQRDIVSSFLKLNGHTVPSVPAQNPSPPPSNNGNGHPVFARMLDIGKMNGRWGDRLFITFQVNDRRCLLFGSAKQLATHITSAGYEIGPEAIANGLHLDLPCRVTTKPSDDGKYVNVDQVFPAAVKQGTGGNHGAAFN